LNCSAFQRQSSRVKALIISFEGMFLTREGSLKPGKEQIR
jgi:hypothetical protein